MEDRTHYMDKVTFQRIATAHPALRDELTKIYGEASEALKGRASLRYSFVLRSPSEQDALYAQGRKSLGEVNILRKNANMPPITIEENKVTVTDAPAWQSMHNYGLAVDIVLIIDGKTASWDTKSDFDGDKQSDWMEVVKVFKAHGWTWGGDAWKNRIDKPHFEKTFGLSLAQLNAKRIAKDFIPNTGYVNLSR